MPEPRPLTGSLRAQIGEVTMTHLPVRLSLRIVAAAFAFSLAGLAQAVIFNSHFDPLTFSGDGQFQFDDSCLAEDGFYNGSDCHATLLSAVIDVSDGVGGTAHVDFGPLLPSTAIFDIEIQGGTLVGVDTDWIGFAFGSPSTGALVGSPWWIRWTNPDFDPVELVTGTCDSDLRSAPIAKFAPLSCQMDLQTSTLATDVTFTRVPEPGTLLLVAGGLFAAWRSRRSARGG